jgi:thiamine kinase-like enzyme
VTTAELSPALAHRLQQTLSQWRQWRCEPRLSQRPEVVGPLGGGASNASVHVRAEGEFVVRLDGISPAGLGLNRQLEWRALQLAHAEGLAPAPRYFNPELGALVCDYLPPDEPQRQDAPAVAELLRGIHRLPRLHHRLDLKERLQHYLRLLQPRALDSAVLGRVLAWVEWAGIHAEAPVLCHNDLLPANRLRSGGRLWAVDWEYCAQGDAWFDLAVVAVGAAETPGWQRVLLEHYLDRPATDQDWHRLEVFGCLYRCLELLWYAAAAPAAADRADQRARMDALRNSLSRAEDGAALSG